ncbi:hypothetical protein [Streptomyces sp. SDr-06]|uniref:hypothetical protein n=1 Tax=Streptomyces sp. SDr-06 TaxID=2267702 RepID=UPI001675097A|nr:hypothetical protein [Streptomyces sp. SDr-06]
MNDHSQELNQPLRGASRTGLTGRFDAPPLRLAGAADEDVSVAAEPHIVRGID